MMSKKVSVNGRIRAVLREHVEGEDRVDVTELMPELVEKLRHDPDFVRQFLAKALYPYAVQGTRQIMAEGRPGRQRVVEARGVVQTEASFKEEAKTQVRPFDWDGWWARFDRPIRLPELNKPIHELKKGFRDDEGKEISGRERMKKIGLEVPDEDPTGEA